MQKKIAVINDISGFGRCSITVTLPILSYLGVQCCPVPTAILSNHMGFPNYYIDDYTDRMRVYIENWGKLGLRFEGIMTGFLGSAEQIDIVKGFIRDFSKEDTLVIVDPVMGDHGKIYATYTEEMCTQMKKLVALSDITTPNLTEACKLSDVPYKAMGWRKRELYAMAEKISSFGPFCKEALLPIISMSRGSSRGSSAPIRWMRSVPAPGMCSPLSSLRTV